jgi:hypothetical protein
MFAKLAPHAETDPGAYLFGSKLLFNRKKRRVREEKQ